MAKQTLFLSLPININNLNNEDQIKSISSRLDLFTHKQYHIHRHVFTWVLYLFIFILSYQNPDSIEPYATYFKIGISLSLFLQAYLNMYWLVPTYLFRNHFLKYLIGLVSILLFFSLLTGLVSYMMRDLEAIYAPKRLFNPMPAMYFAFALVFVTASTGIKLFQRWIEDTRQIGVLTQTSIKAELEQLKNQINPHFLFNMLNNANVLIQKDPQKASQVLMSLSDLLRYQLYDSARQQVLLTADIHFLNDCLALEKIRRDHFEFIISKEGSISGIQIPPFLFITFVENAIKHSQDADQPSFVEVDFKLINNSLYFVCRNSKPKKIRSEKSGGLGLVNVKRRLSLIYDNQYQLNIIETNDLYTVNLVINL